MVPICPPQQRWSCMRFTNKPLVVGAFHWNPSNLHDVFNLDPKEIVLPVSQWASRPWISLNLLHSTSLCDETVPRLPQSGKHGVKLRDASLNLPRLLMCRSQCQSFHHLSLVQLGCSNYSRCKHLKTWCQIGSLEALRACFSLEAFPLCLRTIGRDGQKGKWRSGWAVWIPALRPTSLARASLLKINFVKHLHICTDELAEFDGARSQHHGYHRPPQSHKLLSPTATQSSMSIKFNSMLHIPQGCLWLRM